LRPEHITRLVTANNSEFNNATKDEDLSKAEKIANAVLQAVLEDTTTDSIKISKVMNYLSINYYLFNYMQFILHHSSKIIISSRLRVVSLLLRPSSMM